MRVLRFRSWLGVMLWGVTAATRKGRRESPLGALLSLREPLSEADSDLAAATHCPANGTEADEHQRPGSRFGDSSRVHVRPKHGVLPVLSI